MARDQLRPVSPEVLAGGLAGLYKLFLSNEDDGSGRVTRQTQADGTTFQFAYTVDGSGVITQADVTDPRGLVERLTFNADGYRLTDIRALGQAEQRTTTLERHAGTNLVTAVTQADGAELPLVAQPASGTKLAEEGHNPCRYYREALLWWSMIRSFRDRETEKVFRREGTRKLPPVVQRVAQRELAMLDAADTIEDLRIPPGNRLEKLKGTREGKYSIRINDQWRVCFGWREGEAHEVEIVDYH